MKKLLRIALAVFLVILAAAGAADRAALSEESNDPSRRFPLATYTPAPSPNRRRPRLLRLFRIPERFVNLRATTMPDTG